MHRLSALALAALCSGCTAAAQYRPWPEATLPQPESITVGFNHRLGSSYISPLTGQRRPGDNLEQQLITAIAGAQREVLVAVQELTLPAIAEALIERHRAGVTVKLVLENNYSAPGACNIIPRAWNLTSKTTAPASKAGLERCDRPLQRRWGATAG